jgi:hypothetical protein
VGGWLQALYTPSLQIHKDIGFKTSQTFMFTHFRRSSYADAVLRCITYKSHLDRAHQCPRAKDMRNDTP